MGKRREALLSEILRARVRQMLGAGYSEARIVKETGKSLVHIRRIIAQEQPVTTEGVTSQ